MKQKGTLKTASGEYAVYMPAVVLKLQQDLVKLQKEFAKTEDSELMARAMEISMQVVSCCVPELDWTDAEIREMDLFEELIPAIYRAMVEQSDPSAGRKN